VRDVVIKGYDTTLASAFQPLGLVAVATLLVRIGHSQSTATS
jgi:hypothetical protein